MARTRAQTKDSDDEKVNQSPVRRPSRKKETLINDVPLSQYIRRIVIGTTGALLTLGFLVWVLWTGRLSLTGGIQTDKLSGFGSKLEFTLRFLILPALWLLISDLLVMIARCSNKQEALDPLNEREDLVEVPNNVLRNSMEQALLSLLAQLSIISYLSAADVARVIPLLNVTFFVGRVAYYIGYPKLRSFGFSLTFAPTAAALLFVGYKFFVSTFLA